MNSRSTQQRAYALDALRGFAILTMILSGQIPFHVNTLPDWMYHAQVPPPEHKFIPTLPGITWVDLVFPLFLFAMGASMPLALQRRLEEGKPLWRVTLSIFERGFLLGVFAIYDQHIRPYTVSTAPTISIWLLALLGFVLMFPIYTRFSASWSSTQRRLIKGAGWLGVILFMALIRFPDGSGFSLYRSDIIIIVLTNMAVFGSLIWLLTSENLLLRLGILGILAATRLSNMPAPIQGWVNDLWQFTPAPWIYTLYYQQYLFIVIPGMIAGDQLARWMKLNAENEGSWKTPRLAGIMLLMFAFVIIVLAGLKTRWLLGTTLLTFVMCVVVWWLLSNPKNETEKLLRDLFQWGVYWLILGLFLEPFEGGIKKDRATMSYYFVTSGLAVCMLIAFSILVDILKKKRWLQLLIDNGQNPMIAYAGINNLIVPLLGLTMLDTAMNSVLNTPWLGFLRGVIATLLLAFAVSFFTKRKIFWRT